MRDWRHSTIWLLPLGLAGLAGGLWIGTRWSGATGGAVGMLIGFFVAIAVGIGVGFDGGSRE